MSKITKAIRKEKKPSNFSLDGVDVEIKPFSMPEMMAIAKSFRPDGKGLAKAVNDMILTALKKDDASTTQEDLNSLETDQIEKLFSEILRVNGLEQYINK